MIGKEIEKGKTNQEAAATWSDLVAVDVHLPKSHATGGRVVAVRSARKLHHSLAPFARGLAHVVQTRAGFPGLFLAAVPGREDVIGACQRREHAHTPTCAYARTEHAHTHGHRHDKHTYTFAYPDKHRHKCGHRHRDRDPQRPKYTTTHV